MDVMVYSSDTASNLSAVSHGDEANTISREEDLEETRTSSVTTVPAVFDERNSFDSVSTAGNHFVTTNVCFSSEASAPPSAWGEKTSKKHKECCVCSDAAIYTCPACGRHTCSITCVRVHKAHHGCTGERDVAKKVLLSEFTDEQLQRDYNFLEDCRRVINNTGRTSAAAPRYNFKALPPPLRSLRDAAKKRGVVCQIMSEGMTKRMNNTSRYVQSTDTILWYCEFVFHPTTGQSFTVSTEWGNERHLLGDVLRHCWATDPQLPTHSVSLAYNHATEEPTAKAAKDGASGKDASQSAQGETAASDSEEVPESTLASATAVPPETVMMLREDSSVVVTPRDEEEACNAERVRQFLANGDVVIFSKAERLGTATKYFALNPGETLNAALRSLFFVNEYPVFDVRYCGDVDDTFSLITPEERVAIRLSLRYKDKKTPTKRSEMDPETAERLRSVPCRMHRGGTCALGDECPFWHCDPSAVPPCRAFLKDGRCPRGKRCTFLHDAEARDAARKRPRGGGRRGRGRDHSD